MPDKELLQEQLTEGQQEIEKIKREIADAEATGIHRTCQYRFCEKGFITDDGRRWFCCSEHSKAENLERTRDKNKLRKKS